MDADELLRTAWQAVENAGVPDPHKGIAFKEAIDFIRDSAVADRAPTRGNSQVGSATSSKQGAEPTARRRAAGGSEAATVKTVPDGETFYARLAHESGLSDSELRDVLHLTDDGKVQIVVATKDLGESLAEQARSGIALIASGRSEGLDENPVRADAVREELRRKHCYEQSHFARQHLGPLKGFNAGPAPTDILLSSKWLLEFHAAVSKARGQGAGEGGK
ncbi:MAG: hypothetical protein E6J14_06175 [Chloroflexi bacterium]|nr:MAG: hypothetical protein E6J14_06175 [Chloroflexota bacterium]